MSVCVSVCVRTCVCERVCVSVCVRERVCARACVCVSAFSVASSFSVDLYKVFSTRQPPRVQTFLTKPETRSLVSLSAAALTRFFTSSSAGDAAFQGFYNQNNHVTCA